MNRLSKGLLLLTCLLTLCSGIVGAQSGPDMPRWVIGGGGGTITGENVVIGGAMGQAIAGQVNGGDITLVGGFWTGGAPGVVENRHIYLPLVLRNFFISPYEPNNSANEAYGPLQNAHVYYAYPDDQEDWYYFNLPTVGTITVRVEQFSGGGGRLMVYTENDTTTPVPGGYWSTGGATMSVMPNLSSPGKYYIRVYTGSDTNTSTLYRLSVTY